MRKSWCLSSVVLLSSSLVCVLCLDYTVTVIVQVNTTVTYDTGQSISQSINAEFVGRQKNQLKHCRAVLVDGPSFPLLCVARTDLGMPMDAILVTIQGSER